jgi:type IV secretory pathway TrbL component
MCKKSVQILIRLVSWTRDLLEELLLHQFTRRQLEKDTTTTMKSLKVLGLIVAGAALSVSLVACGEKAEEPLDLSPQKIQKKAGDAAGKAGDAATKAGTAATKAGDAAKEKAGAVGGVAGEALNKTGDAAKKAGEAAGAAGAAAKDKSMDGMKKAGDAAGAAGTAAKDAAGAAKEAVGGKKN